MDDNFDAVWALSDSIKNTMEKCAVEMKDSIDAIDVIFAFMLGAVKYADKYGFDMPEIERMLNSLKKDKEK